MTARLNTKSSLSCCNSNTGCCGFGTGQSCCIGSLCNASRSGTARISNARGRINTLVCRTFRAMDLPLVEGTDALARVFDIPLQPYALANAAYSKCASLWNQRGHRKYQITMTGPSLFPTLHSCHACSCQRCMLASQAGPQSFVRLTRGHALAVCHCMPQVHLCARVDARGIPRRRFSRGFACVGGSLART
jgi:hypothetical protein